MCGEAGGVLPAPLWEQRTLVGGDGVKEVLCDHSLGGWPVLPAISPMPEVACAVVPEAALWV